MGDFGVSRFAKFAGSGKEMVRVETATAFLQSIVTDEECEYSTQKQALNALAFFFKRVCGIEEPVFGVKFKKTQQRVPFVLSKRETGALLGDMKNHEERYALAAELQYGAGLRLSELMSVRIKDIDLDRGPLTIRQGKGDKDRMTVLPKSPKDVFPAQIEKTRRVWDCSPTSQPPRFIFTSRWVKMA